MPNHRPEVKSANLPTYVSQPEAAQMVGTIVPKHPTLIAASI